MVRPNKTRPGLRELLVMLGNSLGHPPLSVKFRLAMEAILDLLGERISVDASPPASTSADLAETLGEKP